jgi:hypothetical protein
MVGLEKFLYTGTSETIMEHHKAHTHEKKNILVKGVLLHLVTYALIGIALTLMGIPPFISFVVVMVLVWGLFVLGYAFYNQK